MPIDQTFFERIGVPEIFWNSRLFTRRLIEGEYAGVTARQLHNFDPSARPRGRNPQSRQRRRIWNRIRELSTFSSDFSRASSTAHQILALESAAYLIPSGGGNSHVDDLLIDAPARDIIRAYSLNSQPFHARTRRWDVAEHYPNMPSDILRRYFFQDNVDPVAELNRALRALPPARFDVGLWCEGYSGNMVFRGALVGLDDSALYSDNGLIRTGDLVTNTDFMSTSAKPQVATEFVIRQMTVPRAGDEVQEANIDAAFYRVGSHLMRRNNRVFFRIDHLSGRNISAITSEEQAEIAFPTRCLFEVKAIEQDELSGLGTLVHLVEIEHSQRDRARPVRNYMTGFEVE